MKRLRIAGLRVIAVLEALIILVLSAFIVWYCFIRSEDSVTTSAQVDDSPQVRVRPVIEKEETYYQFDGKKILMHDSAYGEVFLPVYADVPASDIDPDNLVSRNGYAFYTDGGEIRSCTGVDVSEHQGDIDWEKVKAAGIDFAIVRIGYRTYGGGVITIDENYRKNLEGAAAAGIKTGAYFFSQATSTDEAIEEADIVIDAVAGLDLTYPVVYDWELISGDSARTDAVSVDTLADCCVAFCERVRSAGYKPMIYQNKSTIMKKLDLPRVKDYDMWLAEYGNEPTYYYKYTIWQYTDKGRVPGISGDVDMNLCFEDYK